MDPQLPLPLESAPALGRDDFVVSRDNAAAVARFDAWDGRGGLVLVGPEGVGKTHLAAIWAQRAGARRLERDRSADSLSDTAGAVLLEDADRGAPDELLFHLINMAQRPGGGLLLTARERPSAWPAALPDLRSRLNALPVIELEEPDEATLSALLVKFFRERSVSPSPELLAYLVRRIERSAASAKSVAARLDEAALAQGRPVGRALARQVLGDVAGAENEAGPSSERG